MKIKKIIFQFVCIVSVLTMLGCKKDKNDSNDPVINTNGVFIVNEGAFGSGNGSISFLNLLSGNLYNGIFENVNGYSPGDVVQSMTLHQGKGFIVVNNSQKIEVIDVSTFNSIATINGFSGPRYFVAKGNKGYVSDWFSNEIKIIDLNTHTITGSIPTGSGPEQMVLVANLLFVTNVGGWDSDSTVTVINTNTETVAGTIESGINPNSVQLDINGKLWVLCGGSTGPDFIGGTNDDIAGSLWRINPLSLTVEKQYTMNSSDHPSKLQINQSGTDLYYLNGIDGYNGKIVKLNVNASNAPNIPMTNKEFYGLGIDPVSETIYGSVAPGFSQNGLIFRYNQNFNLLDSAIVGIGPNSFTFY